MLLVFLSYADNLGSGLAYAMGLNPTFPACGDIAPMHPQRAPRRQARHFDDLCNTARQVL